jgi:ATP-dependent helicase/nuclease subunit B
MTDQEKARNARVETWLASGGLVLTTTDRAARSVAAGFHDLQQAAGREAWSTPAIVSWDSWVREQWLQRNFHGLLLMNALQEQSLWSRVIRESRAGTGLLHPDQLASAAQRAYSLLCDYAPNALSARERLGWAGDAAIFGEWITQFESRCRREELISPSRICLDLTDKLRGEVDGTADHPPLLLIGFDRLLDSQRALLDAWAAQGLFDESLDEPWRLDEQGEAAQTSRFYAARDWTTELSACIDWLRARLTADPLSRLMVITTGLQQRRGKIERALLDLSTPGTSAIDFEFSLGVPLSQVGVARSALLLLRWLSELLSETELEWLITSGHFSASEDEELALAEMMRQIRRRGLERTQWTLKAFANPSSAQSRTSSTTDGPAHSTPGRKAIFPPESWLARMHEVQELLRRQRVYQSPLDWAELAVELLETAGWPGFRPLDSVAYQAQQRWGKVLEMCATLGFDGPNSDSADMDWDAFVGTLSSAVATTIFAAESRDAAVQITEPFESAGQMADGIWFLGTDEENWPGRGAPNPLLPIRLQRESGMPHSTPQADWALAHDATARLLSSADDVIFSFAEQIDETEARPSRLVLHHAGTPIAIEPAKTSEPISSPITEAFEDAEWIPFPHTAMAGGAGTLTSQSLCGFQAFATARLGAEHWKAAEAGLNAKQRGQLLHAVLHRVWTREEGGLGTLDELRLVFDLTAFVRVIVETIIGEELPANLRETLPRRFLDLEVIRLTGLVVEWLEYEKQRLPFLVEGTEVESDVTVAGLTLRLRLDRVDVLHDGSKLVIDYKTGTVGPAVWAGERPKDVQLPLYASVAIDGHDEQNLQGLVFARVRPGDTKFYGRARDAANAISPALGKASALVRNPLTDEQLEIWRNLIQQLGEDFLHGKADVNPLLGEQTCQSCELHSICRRRENESLDELIAEDEAVETEFVKGEGTGGNGE